MYFLTYFHTSHPFDPHSAPLTYCQQVSNSSDLEAQGYFPIKVHQNDSILLLFLQFRHCDSNYCEKVVRVCSDEEQPMEFFDKWLDSQEYIYFAIVLGICSLIHFSLIKAYEAYNLEKEKTN
jgi:hypothetical protein